jgi:hypothetical protein
MWFSHKTLSSLLPGTSQSMQKLKNQEPLVWKNATGSDVKDCEE